MREIDAYTCSWKKIFGIKSRPRKGRNSLSKTSKTYSSSESLACTFSQPLTPSNSVISTCIAQLLRELDSATDPSFNTLLKSNWAAIDTVTGPSAWVDELSSATMGVADVVHERVEPKKYVRNFCDRASK